jgi:CcmD family protein
MSNQAPSTTDTSQRSTEFQPVQGGEETTSGEALLVAAYVVMWLLLLFFVWTSWRRQLGLSERLGRLEKALGKPSDGQG